MNLFSKAMHKPNIDGSFGKGRNTAASSLPQKASILFLYPTQALSLRKDIYIEACRELSRTYGHNVVFCYNGPLIHGIDDLQVQHFDTWAESNKEKIDEQDLIELERKFPKSNFWRAAVIERNLTDYSFLGNSFAFSHYSVLEIERYLKALILFYDYILDLYRVNIAFNHVSDNIHAHIIYELAISKGIIPLSLGRGLYWFMDQIYPMTEQNLGSQSLKNIYREYCTNPGLITPEQNEFIEAQFNKIISSSAGNVQPKFIYTKTLLGISKNAISTFRERINHFCLRRPSILESNLMLQLWPALRSYFIRFRNLMVLRMIVCEEKLPEQPFVFFPLHYQPEASILGSSPAWLDQLALIRLLSASIPSGHRLVVKDHPVIGGIRSPSFYNSIINLKNVILLDERISSRTVIRDKGCVLLATIGGTVGIEAMLFGKPVLMFGRKYYDCMETVLHPPNDLNDMPQFMKKLLIFENYPKPAEIVSDIKMFLAAWFSIMEPVGKAGYGAQADNAAAGRDWAKAVDWMIKQIFHADLLDEKK